MSFKENKENKAILNRITLEEKQKNYILHFLRLSLNSDRQLPAGKEVHGGTGEPDKARLDKFNQEFYDTVERGVFRKLTVKDMVDYCHGGRSNSSSQW